MKTELPPELVTEILSRVAVKDLLRFRCVSKTWLRLLSHDSQFIQLHLNRSNNNENPNPSIMVVCNQPINLNDENPNPCVIIEEKTHFYYAADIEACDKAIEFDLPFTTSSLSRYTVAGVCNGLLCFTYSWQRNPSDVYIWNPLTKDNVTIPCLPIPSHFDDGLSYTDFGFGFDQGSNEYKVVRIVTFRQSDKYLEPEMHASVYTLGTNLWRTLEGIDLDICSFTAAFVNGALHWCASSPGSPFLDFVVSFHLKDEVFQVVQIPRSFTEQECYDCDLDVVELGGFLCMVLKTDVDIEIWAMKEYGVVDSWTKQCTIGEPDASFESLGPLGVADNGEIILNKDCSQLIIYDPNYNSMRSLKKFGFEAYDAVYMYRGSLVSPRIINGVRHIGDIEESGRKRKRDDVGAEV